MTPLIALSRSPSRDAVFPGGRAGTEGATTTGGRDKRRGTNARYVVVVFGYLLFINFNCFSALLRYLKVPTTME